MEVAGFSGGMVSLAFDVFDNTIRLFKFLGALVDMPDECEKYRLQLVIEYNRVLAWGKAAGLIDVPEGSTLGVTLGTDPTEPIVIVARIQRLLAEFKDLNSRYGNELTLARKGEQESDSAQASPAADLASRVSKLAISCERISAGNRHSRITHRARNFFRRVAENTKDVITHPARVRWVAVDQDIFRALLEDLHILTERLHELMRDYRGRKIDDITAKTYREMILARNDIQDIKNMLDAVTRLITTSSNTGNQSLARNNDRALQDLLRLKKVNKTSEMILAPLKAGEKLDLVDSHIVTVHNYTPTDLADAFDWNEPPTQDPQTMSRPRGTLVVQGINMPVWVEWKTIGDHPVGSLKDRESALRTAALAEMLHIPKPESLSAPNCVGYFDDREYLGSEQYGWIFKMPPGSDRDTRILSLYDILGVEKLRPSLAQRLSLAKRLCSTLLDLQAANWLHKGIFSDNVIFHATDGACADGDTLGYNPEKPLLSGFEFSRPEGSQTTARDTDTTWDLYRWPSIQRELPTQRNSRKTFDLYSLGLVLLEIAHWQPLHRLLHLGDHEPTDSQQTRPKVGIKEEHTAGTLYTEPDGTSSEDCVVTKPRHPEIPLTQSKLVRDWLLEIRKDDAPFLAAGKRNPLRELGSSVGNRYQRAVTRCLWAHGPNGFEVEASWNQSEGPGVGIALQEAFTVYVIDELEAISV
ncbi:prion-inhibition and propagation-domain-containing protein [Podospora appendiculata]|uniref:Prion-inhibition and propagation-domain-containing protein n=1 Tax=Podospora appendiculata TaxID=314037 RepID=A0AAE1CFM6_9PEZI|nr:prion-inhibition and propagation-domain-containing protein [Podospora appendiculata]